MSKELEALERIKGDLEYIIDIRPKQNKHFNMFGNSLTKEEYDSLKQEDLE